ncbi:replicative DNA helicase [Paenibacillus sp. NPDC058177]|uniref:replicative DNA helicase n=1 Tax=Paenibacillus sp. NPDC058177 TaxID=3346369 RepID=UPI0036DC5C46
MNYYNLEVEQSVLGALLITPDLIYESTVIEEHFYHENHKFIISAILKLRDQEQLIDFVSVSAVLGDKLQDIGGVSYLAELGRSVPTTGLFKSHERLLKEKYLLRTAMKRIKEIYSGGHDQPKELAAELMSVAELIMDQSKNEGGLRRISQGLRDHYESIEGKAYDGVATGYSTMGADLDRVTGKWQKQTLNVIAARPSVGKTSAALNNAVINGKEGLAVAIFSLEQPELQLYDRMIAAECLIDSSNIKTGKLLDNEWEKYTIGFMKLAELNIYIDDRPGLSVQEIRSEVRRFKKEHGEIIVYIDYLQLINGGKAFANRNVEVGYISSSLKQMARENDCPVIALAQLSRGVEQRQDKRPMLSDLRESGNIEQDADTITFLYRDDYYNQETEKRNIIEMIVAKNREGEVGTVEMINLKNYGKFVNYERAHTNSHT